MFEMRWNLRKREGADGLAIPDKLLAIADAVTE